MRKYLMLFVMAILGAFILLMGKLFSVLNHMPDIKEVQ
jgi:hypothetical protein